MNNNMENLVGGLSPKDRVDVLIDWHTGNHCLALCQSAIAASRREAACLLFNYQ
jgi:hypothetical protein